MLNQSFIDLCLTLRGAIQNENTSKENAAAAATEVIDALWDTVAMRDIITGLIAALDGEHYNVVDCDQPSEAIYDQVRAYMILAKHLF